MGVQQRLVSPQHTQQELSKALLHTDADNTPAIKVFDVLGFHCIPHVGVYGEDYYPAIPLFLLALPPSRNLLSPQLLPSTLLHAINFDHLKGRTSSYPSRKISNFGNNRGIRDDTSIYRTIAMSTFHLWRNHGNQPYVPSLGLSRYSLSLKGNCQQVKNRYRILSGTRCLDSNRSWIVCLSCNISFRKPLKFVLIYFPS